MIVLAIHPARHQYHTMSSQQVEIFFFMHDCSFGRPCRQYEQTKPLTSTGPLATSQKITLRMGSKAQGRQDMSQYMDRSNQCLLPLR